MANKLIINTNSKEHRIVLVKHGKVIEYHKEAKNHSYNVGDIHLGTVKKILPNLNAVFVDVGHEKDAFLHYLDLGENFYSLQKFIKKAKQPKGASHDISKIPLSPILKKEGNISQVLKKGERILVQVTKEAISTKGLRLSSAITLPGRYLILFPFGNDISISKRITNRVERERLKKLILAIKPENFSIIVRTNAQDKEAAVLDQDLKKLLKRWQQGVNRLPEATTKDKIIKEVNRISSILRDLLNETFDQIIVDDEATYKQVKEDVSRIDPKKEKIIQLYKGKTKLFEHLDIERQIHLGFSEIINLEGGIYLVIQETEALCVVDVNSGSYKKEQFSQEINALEVNLAAIKTVFYILRLRNIGGVIIVDCISMKDPQNQEKLYQEARKQAETDPARIKVLPLTEFGLLQLTRERTRPTPYVMNQEICPACKGRKKIQNSLIIAEHIEQIIEGIFKKQKPRKLTLFVHPYLQAYFTKGFFSKQWSWFWRYFRWIKLVPTPDLPLTTYKLVAGKNNLLATNPKITARPSLP